jgi:hypothetical protein
MPGAGLAVMASLPAARATAAELAPLSQGDATVVAKSSSKRNIEAAYMTAITEAKFNAVMKVIAADQRLDRLFADCVEDSLKADVSKILVGDGRELKYEELRGNQVRVVYEVTINESRLYNRLLACKPAISAAEKGRIATLSVVRESNGNGSYQHSELIDQPGIGIESVFTANRFRVTTLGGGETHYGNVDLTELYAKGDLKEGDINAAATSASVADNDYLVVSRVSIDDVKTVSDKADTWEALVCVSLDFRTLQGGAELSSDKYTAEPACHSDFGRSRAEAVRAAVKLAEEEAARSLVNILNDEIIQ